MKRKKLLFFLLLLLIAKFTYPLPFDFFGMLQKTAPGERVSLARKIYNEQIIHLDSANAFAALNRLHQWATDKKDISLKTFALVAMGSYQKEHCGDHCNNGLSFFTRALELADANHLQEMQAESYNNIGLIYYKQNRFPQAFEYMIRANNIIQNDIGYEHYPNSGRFLFDLGLIYYDFGNYDKAKQYLLNAIKYPFSNPVDAIKTYNTLALAYCEMRENDSAVIFFQWALDIAKSSHNTAWTGILSGNLGMIYYDFKKYEVAVPLLKTDYTLSVQTGELESAANAMCLLADIDIERKDLPAAAAELRQTALLLQQKYDVRAFLFYALKKARLFKHQGRFDSAFAYLDTARKLQNEIRDKQNAMVFTQAEQKVAIEQHLSEMKLLASEKSKSVLLRNFIIVVILLCLIIAAQFIFRLQVKHKKSKELLSDASTQLNYYIENMREKNKLIEQFRQEIQLLNSMPANDDMLKEKEEIEEKLRKYTILTEDHWNEFRLLFEKVQKGFFEALKQKYPDLTPAELRLLALLKLKLTRKEMATMLGIAPDSIKKTRQRIRRKINLQDDAELEDLVENI